MPLCCSREAYVTSLPNNIHIYSPSFDVIYIKLQLNVTDSGEKEQEGREHSHTLEKKLNTTELILSLAQSFPGVFILLDS